MWYDEEPSLDVLINKICTQVYQNVDDEEGNEAIQFVLEDGSHYKLVHQQDCCESVTIESIVGDLNDLVGEPILLAEKSSNSSDDYDDSETWTFYKFATRKGYVDIRFYGTSNGYYSEGVSFLKIG